MNADPYVTIDPVLIPWANRHGIKFGKIYKDSPVRSVLVYDHNGNRRAQIWADPPNADGSVTLMAAELDKNFSSRWGRRQERCVSLAALESALEELRYIVFEWAGPGAYT